MPKDIRYIKRRLDDIMCTNVPVYEEYLAIKAAQEHAWMWVWNLGKNRNQKELAMRIQVTEEEIMCMDFMGEDDKIKRKCKEAQLKIWREVYRDD